MNILSFTRWCRD